jgi:hypothetical protein
MRREFIKYVNRHVQKGVYNTRQIQDTMSTACGLYCVYVIHEISGGTKIKDILRRFGTNTRPNDFDQTEVLYIC